MKTISRFFYLLFLILLASCKKDVVAPNDEAKGRNILYIEIDDKKYLLRERSKFFYKKQYAEFDEGWNLNKPSMTIGDIDSVGYKNYDLILNISKDKQIEIFGGFQISIWYNESTKKLQIRDVNDYIQINLKEIKISQIKNFTIKNLSTSKKGLYNLNFELSFEYFFEQDTFLLHHSNWKGDLEIIKKN